MLIIPDLRLSTLPLCEAIFPQKQSVPEPLVNTQQWADVMWNIVFAGVSIKPVVDGRPGS